MKCHKEKIENPDKLVAPYAGAWIEIDNSVAFGSAAESLPTRERGLKSMLASSSDFSLRSLPTRERGLKSSTYLEYMRGYLRRSLRGSVD